MKPVVFPNNFTTLDTGCPHPNQSEHCFSIIMFEYEDNPNIVSTLLRRAWTMLPTPSQTENAATALDNFICKNYNRPSSDLENLPQNPDVDTLHTPWRDAVYNYWNVVFYEVGKFMPEIASPAMCHRLQAFEIITFGRSNPKAGEGHAPSGCTSDVAGNVLLILAYLKPGVSFRVSIEAPSVDARPKQPLRRRLKRKFEDPNSSPSPSESYQSQCQRSKRHRLGVWDGSNPYEMWYVKGGSHLTFEFSSDREDEIVDLAAVMLCGWLYEMDAGDLDQRKAEIAETEEWLDYYTHLVGRPKKGAKD